MPDLVRLEQAALSNTLTDLSEFVDAVTAAFTPEGLKFEDVFISPKSVGQNGGKLGFRGFRAVLKKVFVGAMDATTLWSLMGCGAAGCVVGVIELLMSGDESKDTADN